MIFNDYQCELELDGEGTPQLRNHAGVTAFPGMRLAAGCWHRLEFSLNFSSNKAQIRLECEGAISSSAVIDVTFVSAPRRLDELVIAGRRSSSGDYEGNFDGKIEQPSLATIVPHGLHPLHVATWDFGTYEADQFKVPERTGRFGSGTLVNAPTRAVTSSSYRGQDCDFTRAPSAYSAIWFHRDDLGDARWATDFLLTVPELKSGVYSIVISESEDVDWNDRTSFDALPLFVGSSFGSLSKVALVLPTFSYRAYANNTFAESADPRIFKRKKASVSKPLYDYAIDQNLHSLYSVHCDGSGVSLATLKRPQTTVRADFDSQLQGFPHQFSADLAIVGWLEQLGISYDVLTDEMLHESRQIGPAGYVVAITGSHPEYASAEVLDAYDDFAAAGGSIMYLGGNGFYWSVGVGKSCPEIIEVRRSEGTRTWTSGIGERRQQLDGRDGGIWRSLGRPPNLTFGIGFSAHGFSGDGHYRANTDVTKMPLPPRTKRFFEKVGSEPFGVAGLELDRVSREFGSPSDVMVLATAEAMPSGYLPTLEEFGGLDDLIPGPEEALARMIRGDIVMRSLPKGGFIFSVGSIRWCSGLVEKNETRVADLSTAVLLDFLDVSDIPA
jgi:N,N-dimethylformamidase